VRNGKRTLAPVVEVPLRTTLNILLSFAQFEREIIGERTRDKMSAARRKGKWVGGTPVLGYDIDPSGGRLVVNEKEAKLVREIFALFQSMRSLPRVVAELNRRNWTLKSWTSKRGIEHIGRPFQKASLRRLLTHAIYAGKVEYRGTVYAGEHPPIVDLGVWEDVNNELRSERFGAGCRHEKQNALLTGLLFCASCQKPMTPTYTAKGNRRYRYYACRVARYQSWDACPTKSISADTIESSVIEQMRIALGDHAARARLQVTTDDWQAFLSGDHNLIRGIVEYVKYDGVVGRVSLKLRTLVRSEDSD